VKEVGGRKKLSKIMLRIMSRQMYQDGVVVPVVKSHYRVSTPEVRRDPGRRYISRLSRFGNIIAPLKISKPIVPRVLLTLDKVVQSAHAVFAGTAELQW